jgi:hypothetical protein
VDRRGWARGQAWYFVARFSVRILKFHETQERSSCLSSSVPLASPQVFVQLDHLLGI